MSNRTDWTNVATEVVESTLPDLYANGSGPLMPGPDRAYNNHMTNTNEIPAARIQNLQAQGVSAADRGDLGLDVDAAARQARLSRSEHRVLRAAFNARVEAIYS